MRAQLPAQAHRQRHRRIEVGAGAGRIHRAAVALLVHVETELATGAQAADFAALTRRYGVEVIAEKVENERQVVDILELDVGMGQGHLFGEPRAIKEQVLAETDPPAEFLRSTLRSAEQCRRFG